MTAVSALGGRARDPLEHRILIEVEGLCVDYGQGNQAVEAVSEVDLVLRRGQVVGLAGESGSGKSTLAHAITRLLRPPGVITGGRVTFHDGRPAHEGGLGKVELLDAGIETLRRLRWAEVAIVFQSAMNALNPVISVEAQLTDVLAVHRSDMSRGERRDRAEELMEMVGLNPDRLGSYPHELSGGMRQRVMIAMALALEPQLVIMDEPTTALDVVTQREILTQIMSLKERLGFSVLFITHDLSLLIEMADSIAVMYAGRLVEQAAAADLFRSPRHPYTLGLLESFPSLHGEKRRLSGIPGSPPNLRHLPSGCTFAPRCRWAMERCVTEPPALSPVARLAPGAGVPRAASCWLQHGEGVIPAELSRREPDAWNVGAALDWGPEASNPSTATSHGHRAHD